MLKGLVAKSYQLLSNRPRTLILRGGVVMRGYVRSLEKDTVQMLIEESSKAGITGKSLTNLLATIEAESGFEPLSENHVFRDVDRAKMYFSALREYSDNEVKTLINSGKFSFFETVYGPNSRVGRRELGNRFAGDGGKFYGRGLIQITGRSNYEAASRALGVDLIANPDLLVSDKKLAVRCAVWYWNARVRALGSDIDIVRATRVVNPGEPDISNRVQAAKAFDSILNA